MYARLRKDKNCGCTVQHILFLIALYRALQVAHAAAR